MRKLLLATASLAILAAAPVTAQAQEFTTLYVFGDSLSDPGNLYDLTGGTNPASPPYDDGRFSNGDVWAQMDSLTVFEFVGANPEAANFAFGGARTGDDNAIDITNQVAGYVGGLGANPADPAALYAIWGGANDYLNRLGVEETAAIVEDVVTNIAGNIQTLAMRGATKFTVFNLPDLGATPGGIGSGNAAALSLVTDLHNGALQDAVDATVAGLASVGVTIEVEVIDIKALFDDVLANPAQYGMANTSIPCLDGVGAATGACPSEAAEDTTLFFDPIHPTTAAHAQIALYLMGSYQQAGTEVASQASVLGELGGLAPTRAFRSNVVRLAGIRSGQQMGSTFNGRQLAAMEDGSVSDSADELGNRTAMGSKKVAVWAQGDWYDGDADGSSTQPEYDYNGWIATAGLDYIVSPHLTIGASVGFGQGESDTVGTTMSTDYDSWVMTTYGSATFSNFYVDAVAGFSLDEYDTSRATLLGNAVANPDGETYFIGAEAGYNFQYGAMSFGPLASLRYTKTEIDGYTETGAGALNMTVGAQDNESVIGGIGAQVSGRFGEGTTIMPNLRVVAERELSDDGRTVATTTSGGVTNSLSVEADDDVYFRVGAGATIHFNDAFQGVLDYEAGIDDTDVDHAVTGRLRVRF